MSKVIANGFAGVVASAMVGCVALLQSSPADKAAKTEKLQCEPSSSPQGDLQLIQSTRVLSVEPKLMYSLSAGSGRCVGAKIWLRPPEGVSTNRLTRVLQCHGARAFLGHVDRSMLPHDPYYLPDAWVSIEVSEQEGNYVAVVSTDKVPDNLRLVDEANAFAAAQRATAPPAAQ